MTTFEYNPIGHVTIMGGDIIGYSEHMLERTKNEGNLYAYVILPIIDKTLTEQEYVHVATNIAKVYGYNSGAPLAAWVTGFVTKVMDTIYTEREKEVEKKPVTEITETGIVVFDGRWDIRV